MFSRRRQRAASGTPAASKPDRDPALEENEDRYSVNGDQKSWTDEKNHGPRQWKVRARSVTARLAVWACRGTGVLAAWLCIFAWLRRLAMAEVVSTSRQLGRVVVDGDRFALAASFTVLVNTFKRPLQLEGTLRHYATCDRCVFVCGKILNPSFGVHLSFESRSSVVYNQCPAQLNCCL